MADHDQDLKELIVALKSHGIAPKDFVAHVAGQMKSGNQMPANDQYKEIGMKHAADVGSIIDSRFSAHNPYHQTGKAVADAFVNGELHIEEGDVGEFKSFLKNWMINSNWTQKTALNPDYEVKFNLSDAEKKEAVDKVQNIYNVFIKGKNANELEEYAHAATSFHLKKASESVQHLTGSNKSIIEDMHIAGLSHGTGIRDRKTERIAKPKSAILLHRLGGHIVDHPNNNMETMKKLHHHLVK